MLNFSAGVRDLQRQSVGSSVHYKEFNNLELNLLSATLDRLSRIWDFTNNIDDTLVGNIRHVGDHFLGCGFGFEGTGLKGVKVLSEDNKTVISFSSDIVNPGSDEDFLSFEGLVDLRKISPLSFRPEGWLDEGIVSKLIFGVVDNSDLFLWLHDSKIIMAFK